MQVSGLVRQKDCGMGGGGGGAKKSEGGHGSVGKWNLKSSPCDSKAGGESGGGPP